MLWTNASEAPKALQASKFSGLLDPVRENCWISAQHQPSKFSSAQQKRRNLASELNRWVYRVRQVGDVLPRKRASEALTHCFASWAAAHAQTTSWTRVADERWPKGVAHGATPRTRSRPERLWLSSQETTAPRNLTAIPYQTHRIYSDLRS